MAAGTIFTVLSNIPWRTVIENAPKLADSAVRLWGTVSGWRKSDPAQAVPDPATDDPLQRLQTLEESVRHLNEQMQMSSQLLKSLAEQNLKLVERVELNRRRVARLTRLGGGLIVGLVVLNIYLLTLITGVAQ